MATDPASANEFKSLIKKRGCIKGKLTNFANYVAKIQGLKNAGSEIKDSDKVQFQERLNKIVNLYDDSFEPVQVEIEQLALDLNEQINLKTNFIQILQKQRFCSMRLNPLY
ncbi:unnamed protein product [Ceutorhynchus assimilis]|uniref:Uncharacterized protein n=1 Tax=Ceutorhynchus assimilis TaxID=467358 RepID=A0A9N9MJ71_9CUCU|nr:unnamed protein product [Ceutorhynchus assimilis]